MPRQDEETVRAAGQRAPVEAGRDVHDRPAAPLPCAGTVGHAVRWPTESISDQQVNGYLTRQLAAAFSAATARPRSLFIGLGASSAPIVRRWRASGYAAICFDPCRHVASDWSRPAVRQRIVGWLRGSVVLGVWASPSSGPGASSPCSRAVWGSLVSLILECHRVKVPLITDCCRTSAPHQLISFRHACSLASQSADVQLRLKGSVRTRPRRLWVWAASVPRLLPPSLCNARQFSRWGAGWQIKCADDLCDARDQ